MAGKKAGVVLSTIKQVKLWPNKKFGYIILPINMVGLEVEITVLDEPHVKFKGFAKRHGTSAKITIGQEYVGRMILAKVIDKAYITQQSHSKTNTMNK
jgi:putative transposon-encoded protein